MEAEDDAHRRDQDTSGTPAATVCLGPAELSALRAAIDACLVGAGHHSRILVARAGEALDDLREELAAAERLIAAQQARMKELYDLFTSPEADSE